MTKKLERDIQIRGLTHMMALLQSSKEDEYATERWESSTADDVVEYWLITGQAGAYDSFQSWVVSVHATQEDAEAVLADFKANRPEPILTEYNKTMVEPYMWCEYAVEGPYTSRGTFFSNEFQYD